MTDLTTWTDEELCRELAAWTAGGENARLEVTRVPAVQREYDRRCGKVEPTEDEWFDRLMTRLREAQGEAA